MAEKEFDPTVNSALVNGALLEKHVLEKGFQMGGVLSLLVFAPLKAFRMIKTTPGPVMVGPVALRVGATTALWATTLSGGS